MPISSVSRVYDAQDPILETDLELLAKVNVYQQSKFDAGSAALQQEVNNWAMMANIAKPELKEYANQKLNNLVNGVRNLGGVNLSDINNVNSLKSLGYNVYGDQRIVDGVVTTQKMKALQTASQTHLSGKDAAKYDPTVADYLMKGYSEWASDGNVENTRYDGPTDLPMGNMNTINTKVNAYLKDLKPDSDSTPSGDLQKSYGYFQVEGKWLKGNRIQEAIQAVTDENDSLIFKAHGWKALAGDDNKSLIGKLGVIYDNTSAGIKNQINYLQAELNQTPDGGRKLELTKLIGQQKQALTANDTEKAGWSNKADLNQQEREGIQASLYRNAWQSNVTNSYSYGQEKKELKANMPLIFHDRMQQQAYQWSKDYEVKVADFDLKKQKLQFDMQEAALKNSLSFSMNSPYGLPLTQEANTGEENQQKSPKDFMDNITGSYFKMNAEYYQYMNNMMGANDTAGRYFQDANKMWKPKPEYKDQIEQEVSLLSSKLDNYSNLTDDERKGLNIPTDPDELKTIFDTRSKINMYNTYRKMAETKETEIINNAIANNSIDFDWRNVPINIGSDYKKTTVGEALALYKAGVYDDNTEITGIGVKPGTSTSYDLDISSFKDLSESVNSMRDNAEKSYEKVGGKIFNTYSVPIPFGNIPKIAQEVIKKQLSPKLGGADYNSIEPLRGQINMNFKTGQPEYNLEVQSGTGKTLKTETIDVTDMIKSSPMSGIGLYYPKSDVSLVWGLNLSETGSTPFAKQDNYKDALRTEGSNYPYQVSTMNNQLNGTTGLKVKVALPVGNGTTVEINVKNLQNGSTTFPTSIEAVQQYLNDWLSTPQLKARFYKEHGLTLN